MAARSPATTGASFTAVIVIVSVAAKLVDVCAPIVSAAETFMIRVTKGSSEELL